MDRYAYLATLFANANFWISGAVVLLLIFLLALQRRSPLDPALFVPVYYPATVVVVTAVVLLSSGNLQTSNLFYILLLTFVYCLFASRAYFRLVRPWLLDASSSLSPAALGRFSAGFVSVYALLAILLHSAVVGGESRISYLFTGVLFRLIAPFQGILNYAVVPLAALAIIRRCYTAALLLFSAALLASYLAESKGSGLIVIFSSVLLALSLRGVSVRDFLRDLPIKQSSGRSALAIIGFFVAVFVVLIAGYLSAMDISFFVVFERILQNADAIFMYFPDPENVAATVCTPLGWIAPVHRGLGALLGNAAAADPATIFGIALNSLYVDGPLAKLEGPNSLLPAWSHCYYGIVVGPLVVVGLFLLFWFTTVWARRLLGTGALAIVAASLSYAALGFYQEVSLLTSLPSLLLLVVVGAQLFRLLPVRSHPSRLPSR
jgi:hypothetical protein